MPKLRKYRDGSGFYLSDYLHGVGYCTWQIGREGIEYLRARGVKAHGENVGGRDRNELRDRGWIWVTGSSPDRLPPGTTILAADLRPLAETLGRWASRGGLDELQRVLHGATGDHRDRCFSPSFLKWLAALDPALGLAGLDRISAADFEDLAGPVLDGLKDPLHGFFARRGDVHVLWQLARVAALVALQRRGSTSCPRSWRAHYPVLHRLFSQIGDLATPPGPKQRSGGRGRRLALPPRIVWEVSSSEIVALLPAQKLPPTIRGLTWRTGPTDVAPQPQTWTDPDGLRVEETRTPPLPPAPVYLIETELHGQLPLPGDRQVVQLPDRFEPCVLFSEEGTMLGVSEEDILLPGDYLALVRKEVAGKLFKARGVHRVDRVDIAPVGWHAWQGWRLFLEPGAEVAPYVVGEGPCAATWNVEPPPEAAVRWREVLAVYTGPWPRIFVTSPAAFAGAVVEVGRDPAGGADHLLEVGVPGGVPVRSEQGLHFLDFNAVGMLAQYYGSVRLTCRPPSQPGAAPLTARFIRLPEVRARYVPDPICPEQALAVEVQAAGGVLAGITSDAHTEVLPTPGGVVLRAKSAHVSPGVCALLSKHPASIRVRVPATRLALVTEGSAFLGWQAPPLSDLDLSAVEAGDRLRIELHEEPALEDDRLLCRLVGGEEIAAGCLVGAGGPVWQFEVELHRWRDGFGSGTGSTVQARTCRRWADIVQLCGRMEEPAPEQAPARPASRRGQLVAALEEALARDDWAEVRALVAQSHAYIGGTKATPVDKELLLLAAAQPAAAAAASKDDLRQAERCLADLGERPDLPEGEIIRRTIRLRLGPAQGGGSRMPFEEVERMGDGLPDLAQSLLFRAECWYRFCRQAGERAPGGWQTCLALCAQFLSKTAGRPWERGAALLLRALGRLMLALEPDSAPTVSSTTPTDAWLAGLRLAAQSVRTPRYRVPSSALPSFPGGEITILCPEDAALVRIAVAHASGRPAEEELFAILSTWGSDQFFAIHLLRARQARLTGRASQAKAEYNRVLRQAMATGPDFLLDVEAGERIA